MIGRLFSVTSICIVTSLFLALELILSLSGHGSLCPTPSCQVAADATRFGNHSLVGLGAAYFLGLGVLWLMGRAQEKGFWQGLFMAALFAGLAFDGAILGFQFFNLTGKCPICWGVAAILLGVTAFAAVGRQSVILLLCGLLIWCASFAANGAVIASGKTASLEKSVLWRVQVGEPTPYPIYHLFFMIGCPHCTTVIQALNEKMPPGKWLISFVDKDSEALRRISAIGRRIDEGAAVIPTLETCKDNPDITQPNIPAKIRSAILSARDYFGLNSLKLVPTLMVQSDAFHRTILTGDEPILKYLSDREARQQIADVTR
jgi:hypothetical protein